MKKLVHITAQLDQPELLENMVEKLVYRKNAPDNQPDIVGNWQMVDTSSIEKYANGTMELDSAEGPIRMPFITRFFFSCTRRKNHPFKLHWCASLS